MKRLALGAALGGLAAYLYDPELGENRRGRLSMLWRENRDGAAQAGRYASESFESARPVARRISKAIGRGNWPVVIDRGRRAASLPGLVVAAVLGGSAVYFMDPANGSTRRLQALARGRRAFGQVAGMVKPMRGRIGDQFASAVDRIKAQAG